MRSKYYNVSPRYTPGSPAMVDETTARRVAQEEPYFYQHALEGAWGEKEKARAEKMGVDFIVYQMKETTKGWEILDLITGKKHLWPFTSICPHCGSRKVRCEKGRIVAHLGAYSHHSGVFECKGGDYVGKEIP